MRMVEYSNTYNESEPARLQRRNLFHSFIWNILGTAQSFYQAKNCPRMNPNNETMAIQVELCSHRQLSNGHKLWE